MSEGTATVGQIESVKECFALLIQYAQAVEALSERMGELVAKQCNTCGNHPLCNREGYNRYDERNGLCAAYQEKR